MLIDELNNLFKYLDEEKEEFTFLDVIGKEYDENIISNWLAYLFDCDKCRNGKKVAEAIIRALNKEVDDIGEFEKVTREFVINEKRRIDIVIEYTNAIIVIENKICSYEQEQQTQDYYEFMQNYNKEKRRYYVFLKPTWNMCELNNKTEFVKCTYKEFIQELEKVESKDKYLSEFIEAVKKYYVKEYTIDEDIKKYIKYESKWKKLETTYKKANNNIIINKLLDRLREKFKEYKISEYPKVTSYIQIYKDNWKNESKNGIHFEIYCKNGNLAYLLNREKNQIKIVVHIEGNIEPSQRETLKEAGVIHELGENIECNFKNEEEIEKSINNIMETFEKLKNLYGETIDRIMNDNV